MDEPNRCASCDVEFRSSPVDVGGVAYCCGGCAQGGPCICSYDGDPETATRPRNGHADHALLDLYEEMM